MSQYSPESSNRSGEPTTKATSPKVVKYEREGIEQRRLLVGFTDIDGTVNKETEPEIRRISTIGPAREALARFQDFGIPFGVITARSLGEAELYLDRLDAKGATICEDGASIVFPKGFTQEKLPAGNKAKILSHNGRFVAVLGGTGAEDIKDFLDAMQQRAIEKDPSTARLISTVTSTPKEIQQAAGHETEELARLSAERLASAYVVKPSPIQADLIHTQAGNYGLRTFQRNSRDPILIFGKQAHKGDALEFINDNASMFFPGTQNINGICPIVFGNHTNDLPLFEMAHNLGGIGVIVQKPDGTYAVREKDIPSYLIKANAAYGYGLQTAAEIVMTQLQQKYGLS